MNSPLRWCLFLVLVGIMISGAAGCTQQQEVNLPYISTFEVSSQVLQPGDAAHYVIKVNNAEEILLYEAGINIGRWNGPPSGTHTHKITFQGMPANAIPTDNGKFEARLVVSNAKGKQDKELMLSVAAPAIAAAGQPGASTAENKSYWLEQSFLSEASPEPAQDTSNASPPMENPPQFADCDCASGCNYCLEAGDAASGGFTQKCSDEPCFSSPNQNEEFYCYKEPEGWCCNNTQVSQSTKTECTNMGGSYWSINQNEAIQACQPKGYCCYNGQVYYPVTQAECAQRGGSYWSTDQAQVMERCQPATCWCCTNGRVFQMTQAECAQEGGTCYATQAQALEQCRKGEAVPPAPELQR